MAPSSRTIPSSTDPFQLFVEGQRRFGHVGWGFVRVGSDLVCLTCPRYGRDLFSGLLAGMLHLNPAQRQRRREDRQKAIGVQP